MSGGFLKGNGIKRGGGEVSVEEFGKREIEGREKDEGEGWNVVRLERRGQEKETRGESTTGERN